MEAQVTVVVDSSGRVSVRSNVHDQIALYGILEMGKDAIRHQVNQNGTGVVAAPAEALNKLASPLAN